MKTTFNVFYMTPGEFSQAVIMPGFKPAEFATIEDARAYIAGQVSDENKVQPSDNSDSATIRYEVYEGSPYNEEGEVTANPVFMSDEYYMS